MFLTVTLLFGVTYGFQVIENQISHQSVTIKISGGTSKDSKYLGAPQDLVAATPKVNLWPQDDGSGRQRWILKHLFDDVYNILVYDGAPAGFKYLSSTAWGSVDLWKEDNGSGRQRWIFKKVTIDTYNIMVYGGTYEGELYLSTTRNGMVELYSKDDNSGRQKWIVMGNGFSTYDELHVVLFLFLEFCVLGFTFYFGMLTYDENIM